MIVRKKKLVLKNEVRVRPPCSVMKLILGAVLLSFISVQPSYSFPTSSSANDGVPIDTFESPQTYGHLLDQILEDKIFKHLIYTMEREDLNFLIRNAGDALDELLLQGGVIPIEAPPLNQNFDDSNIW